MITTHAMTRALINLTEKAGAGRTSPRKPYVEQMPIGLGSTHDEAPHGRTQDISPYVNPNHVLAPPRAWLEAVTDGSISWEFFRLRYKNLLRSRLKDDPESFFGLLDEAGPGGEVELICHCLTAPCHVEVAREFLAKLRDQESYARWVDMRRQVTLFPMPLHHASTAAR